MKLFETRFGKKNTIEYSFHALRWFYPGFRHLVPPDTFGRLEWLELWVFFLTSSFYW